MKILKFIKKLFTKHNDRESEYWANIQRYNDPLNLKAGSIIFVDKNGFPIEKKSK